MSFQTVYLPSIQGITRVQNAAGGVGAANASNFNITFGSNYTAGNLICLAICAQSPTLPNISAISPGVIAFEQAAPVAPDVAGTVYGYLAWGKVITGGNAKISVVTASTGPITICGVAAEYSGINISPDAFPAISAAGAVGTNVITGAVTNANPNALYIAVLGQRFTSAAVNTAFLSAPGAPFSIVQQISTNLNGTNQDRGVGLLDAIVTTAAARTANATSGFNGRFVGVLGTFNEIPAAVPTGAAW